MTNEKLSEAIKRIEKLEKAVFGTPAKKVTPKSAATVIDFSINERAFVKKYAMSKSGPKKFTLLLAFFAKGEINKHIDLKEVIGHWNKMSARNMLGRFNMFYPNSAKNSGWVDSKEYGKYILTNKWREVL